MRTTDNDHEQAALRARIGRAVDARRVALRLEPAQLARESGTDLSQLMKLLRGDAGASVYALERIARVLGWELADLFAAASKRRRSRRSNH